MFTGIIEQTGTLVSLVDRGGVRRITVEAPGVAARGPHHDVGVVQVVASPTRVGPTVFELGYPDRTARKFRHGEDWWVGDIGPSFSS